MPSPQTSVAHEESLTTYIWNVNACVIRKYLPRTLSIVRKSNSLKEHLHPRSKLYIDGQRAKPKRAFIFKSIFLMVRLPSLDTRYEQSMGEMAHDSLHLLHRKSLPNTVIGAEREWDEGARVVYELLRTRVLILRVTACDRLPLGPEHVRVCEVPRVSLYRIGVHPDLRSIRDKTGEHGSTTVIHSLR